MSVFPLNIDGDNPTVVTSDEDFRFDGNAVHIRDLDESQFKTDSEHCNISYDLHVGALYRDHRQKVGRPLNKQDEIRLLPGMAVIIQTQEHVHFPKRSFGQIVPKMSMLQKGFANTPSKVDPGYDGKLWITAFNHGRQAVSLKRGDAFCSMYVLDVYDGVRPYTKGAKDIEIGKPQVLWLTAKDYAEANAGTLLIGLFFGFIGLMITSIVALWK